MITSQTLIRRLIWVSANPRIWNFHAILSNGCWRSGSGTGISRGITTNSDIPSDLNYADADYPPPKNAYISSNMNIPNEHVNRTGKKAIRPSISSALIAAISQFSLRLHNPTKTKRMKTSTRRTN